MEEGEGGGEGICYRYSQQIMPLIEGLPISFFSLSSSSFSSLFDSELEHLLSNTYHGTLNTAPVAQRLDHWSCKHRTGGYNLTVHAFSFE